MTPEFSRRKQFHTVLGQRMAYIEEGEGDPIVFLHGNPTSSYLWRNILPLLRGRGRLIAPDLIGMGDSDKLVPSGSDRYHYTEHRRYLFALLEALDVRERVTLVIHDWGSALGFDWAQQHPAALKGIAFMEAIVAPMPSWNNFPAGVRPVFQAFRSPAGEKLVLEDNTFVEKILPGAILRTLGDEEMAEYRRPFLEPGESRRPTLSWPRQLPIEGQPPDVVDVARGYAAWLVRSTVPKLFINAEPGALVTGELRELVRSWPNLTEVTVKGVHFVQEDSPQEIGQAIAQWLEKISTGRG
jgi:haloalkane dehalogenase